MHMRAFTQHDWHAFAGAQPWPDHPPLFGQGRLADGREYVLVLDPTGACLVIDDEQAAYGGYALERAFPAPAEARAFAEALGEPRTRGEFLVEGFHEV